MEHRQVQINQWPGGAALFYLIFRFLFRRLRIDYEFFKHMVLSSSYFLPLPIAFNLLIKMSGFLWVSGKLFSDGTELRQFHRNMELSKRDRLFQRISLHRSRH